MWAANFYSPDSCQHFTIQITFQSIGRRVLFNFYFIHKLRLYVGVGIDFYTNTFK